MGIVESVRTANDTKEKPWRRMCSAPMDGTWVEVIKDNDTFIACYRKETGDDIYPPFQGWYCKAGVSVLRISPDGWRELEEQPKKYDIVSLLLGRAALWRSRYEKIVNGGDFIPLAAIVEEESDLRRLDFTMTLEQVLGATEILGGFLEEERRNRAE